MLGHATRSRPGTSHRNQVFAASNQVPSPQRSQMCGLYRRHNCTGSQHGAVRRARPDRSESSPQSEIRHPSGQNAGSTSAASGVSMFSSHSKKMKMQARVPQDKVRNLRRQIHLTVKQTERDTPTVRRFASSIDKITFLKAAVLATSLHIWPLLQLQKPSTELRCGTCI